MLDHAEFASGISSICMTTSWSVVWCDCGPLWSVSDAVVSDTGVVEALMLTLSVVSNGSSAIDMFAAGGIGIGSLELEVPILWFVSGVSKETLCLYARLGVINRGSWW